MVVDEKDVQKTVEKTVDRLSEILEKANRVAQDLEVKDRLTDAVAALRRTRVTTQPEEAGLERFVTGLLVGVAVGFGIALLLAPKSGEEMREDLMQKGIELRDQIASRTQSMGDGEGGSQRATSEQTGLA